VEQRNTLPILSPDGKHVAWFVNRLGLPGRVWVADIDGSNAFPLTTDATPDSVASWLADGSSVAIAKIGPQTQVLSISLADRSRRPLVTIPMRVVLPRLARDGRSAVFHNVDGGVPNIWKVALDGSPPIALTQDPEGAIFPSWSQDGGWIAFQLIRGDDAFVAVMPAAGGVPVQLTTMPGKSWSYSWAPDNDRIAFAGFDVGQWQIYSVSRTTREVRKLTSFHDSNGFVRYPAWSVDGRRIVFEHAESAGNIFAADLVTDNLSSK
jgi:Tol biopolymer transport system component